MSKKPTIEKLKAKWLGKRVRGYEADFIMTGVVDFVDCDDSTLKIVNGRKYHWFHFHQCRLLKPRKKQSVEMWANPDMLDNPDAFDTRPICPAKNLFNKPVRVRITRVKEGAR
jgi:hypothetical protein